MLDKIDSFSGLYRFLSNFYPCLVQLDSEDYPSVEHAYQAAKTLDPQLRLWLQEPVVTAGEAKKIGRRLKLRHDWDDVKLGIMEGLIHQKFNQDKFKNLLLSTGDAELIEGNWWNDRYWGVCKGVGENHLGKILMKVRSELK